MEKRTGSNSPAKELGVKMSFSSDAHEPEQLNVMKYGVKVARRGWLEKKVC